MAIYHWEAQIFSRSKEHSAVAAAAYRAGERIQDNASKATHDYSKLRDRVAHSTVILPDGAAAWLGNREQLWNHVHRHESKRVDSQLAREINIALPHELTLEQHIELMERYIRAEFTSRGMVADLNIHQPDLSKGQDARHWHAHIQLPLRAATANGLHNVKTREWNALFRAGLDDRRRAWEEHCNAALARHGHEVRVDRRTLAAQQEEARKVGNVVGAILLNRRPQVSMSPRQLAEARKHIARAVGKPVSSRELPEAVRRNGSILAQNESVAFQRKIASAARPDEAPLLNIMPLMPIRNSVPAKSMFDVSPKDLMFGMYRMGFISLDHLRTSLEKIGFEEASRQSFATLQGFQRRLQPAQIKAAQQQRNHRAGPRRKRSTSPL
ncbi:MAG: MobA/MobL family protein [Hyphomicrobiaceae bacterium]